MVNGRIQLFFKTFLIMSKESKDKETEKLNNIMNIEALRQKVYTILKHSQDIYKY